MAGKLEDDPSAVCRAVAVHLTRSYNMQRTGLSVVQERYWMFPATRVSMMEGTDVIAARQISLASTGGDWADATPLSATGQHAHDRPGHHNPPTVASLVEDNDLKPVYSIQL